MGDELLKTTGAGNRFMGRGAVPRLDDLTLRQLRAFRRSLLGFYDQNKRDLPWRSTRDPYAVLVSEVMLQQTRVETVVPYFRRWMERFPTASALADAETDDVLQVWQGLGYYSRARNLQGAVREIESQYGGTIPRDPDELESLPGIGRYTAGAVASIAFGAAVPAVDGNARRVLARLTDDPDPTPTQLDSWASRLVDPGRPGAFNQALMELGSTVCTPRAPACGRCPIARWCAARTAGTAERRPRPKRKRPIPTVLEVVAVVVARGILCVRLRLSTDEPWRVLLRKRANGRLLGGMWELPGREVRSEARARSAALDLAGELVGTPQDDATPLAPLIHAFSHRRMRYLPYFIPVSGASGAEAPGLLWASRAQTDALALPSAQRKLLSIAWSQLPEGAAEGIAQMG